MRRLRGCARGLNPNAFRTCWRARLEGGREQTDGQLGGQGMAVDGKTSRHSFDRATGRSPLHLVSAWATDTGLVLGRVAVEEQSNEITALPELLTILELAGGIVTIDAMGTQKKMAKTIVEEADDVLALKGNEGTLSADVEWFFQWADAQPYGGMAHGTHETPTTGHGRVERRRTSMPNVIEWRQGRKDWAGLQTIVMVEAWRTQGHETSYDRRYYSSSLGSDTKQIGESMQGHWAIEHSLH